jgi:bleomycin hydrolase
MNTQLDIYNFNYQVTPMQLAVYNNPLSNLGKNWETIATNPFLFNHEVTGDFKITDQKSSGRCWLFATLNLVRFVAANTWKDVMDTKELEFSQSYSYFWDKYERYHRYLRYYININSSEDSDDKCHQFVNICKDPLGDGGQWDMAKEIIKKYGVVPKKIYPDSQHAKSSAGMNMILTEMLKQDWIRLNKSDVHDHESLISEMMKKVFNTLVSFLGKPPTSFDWEFSHKNSTKVWKNITPLELLEKISFIPDEWVSVVHDPRKENPYNKYYQVQYLGNLKDQHVGWLNVDIQRLKELTVNSIKDNNAVWFGCDVGAHRDRESGVHHPNIIDYHKILELTNTMNKEDRLRFYQSVPSHAMVFTGYHSDEDKVKRWKVENSWGTTYGINGYLLFTDEWFEEYVFQVVINKKYLNDDEIIQLDNVYKIIKPWDPLGTLANV